VVCLAPRAREESVRPRRLADTSVRPLNFSVRRSLTMRISPHLTFNGQCQAAFLAYQKLFGGAITTMLTYGASPMAPHIDPQWHERIVHATLLIGQLELTGTDIVPKDYKEPQGFFVTVTIGDAKRAGEIFDSLASNGVVHLPFQATFWSPGFGVVVDRYAVPWEINVAAPASSA
jgi:PhnB protein